MCVQLARVETPEGARFISTGTPDAGVECYCLLPGKDEWGWQAKYFISSLTNIQWQQLDGSIETALNKHPRLVHYYVCVPRDRSDARVANQTSEMDRWNEHVAKWQSWAIDRDMNVEFVWWGSSELIDRLSHEEHVGRRFFWFGQHEFSQNWFRLHLDEGIKAAGPKYTPEVHVDLPIAQDMERFSRSQFLFDEVKSLSVRIRRARDGVVYAQRSSEIPVDAIDLDDLSNATDGVLEALSQLDPSPFGHLSFPEIARMAEKGCESGMHDYGANLGTATRAEANK